MAMFKSLCKISYSLGKTPPPSGGRGVGCKICYAMYYVAGHPALVLHICHIYLCLGPGEQVLVPPPLALLQPHHHPALPGPGAQALGPAIRASAPRRHCHAQLHHHFGHLGQGLFQVCSHLLRERVKLERKAWSLETVSWYSWVLSTSTAPSIPSRCRMAPGKSR